MLMRVLISQVQRSSALFFPFPLTPKRSTDLAEVQQQLGSHLHCPALVVDLAAVLVQLGQRFLVLSAGHQQLHNVRAHLALLIDTGVCLLLLQAQKGRGQSQQRTISAVCDLETKQQDLCLCASVWYVSVCVCVCLCVSVCAFVWCVSVCVCRWRSNKAYAEVSFNILL